MNRYLVDSNSSGDRLSLSEQVISDGLAQLYDNHEFSLRDYEGKTSDTSKSLSVLLSKIENMPMQEMTGDPEDLLIYDIGAGDGRIAIPLAMTGATVAGIDYSRRMAEDSKSRPKDFVDAIENNKDDHLVARSLFKSLETLRLSQGLVSASV